MRPTRRSAALGAALLILGLIGGWALRGFMAVDSCLDAGGAWEERGGYCAGASER